MRLLVKLLRQRASMLQNMFFLKEFLRSPANIGAICPSSKYLAKTVCSLLPPMQDDLVVEIGPGMGAISGSLSQAVSNPQKLLLVERSPHFFRALCERYPHLSVLQGDAENLQLLLPAHTPVSTIVSSMPLTTIPADYKKRILKQFYMTLKNNSAKTGRLVFVSYNMFCNKDILQAGFVSQCHRIVLRNIPPARIDCFIPV